METPFLPVPFSFIPDVRSILLIDDKEENLTGYENVLENPSLRFLKAQNGNDGITLANNNDISLILLDVQMPGLTGFEVVKTLKSSRKTENIPIIFVTGMGNDLKFALQGYTSGAVDYINKPINAEFLRARVNVFLKLDKQRREIENQNSVLQRLSMMVEHSADLMCILNKETLVFEEINPAFQKNLGYSFDELKNEKIIHLFSDLKDVLGFEYTLQRYKDARSNNMHFQCRLKAKDNVLKWISFNITEQLDKWFVNGQEITELKAMEIRLRTYNSDLQQLTELISHEIKTPLNNALHYVNLMYQECQSENATGYLDNVALYLQKAAKLVEEINIYALSRDEKHFTLTPGNEIIEQAMENLQLEINRRQAVIEFENLPVVYGIESQLVILFQNLISNSLEFCLEKKPEITITALEMKDKVIFIYNDNSIGVDRHRDMNLKICSTIVKRHGGTVSFDTSHEKGITSFISILKKNTKKKSYERNGHTQNI